MVMLANSSLHCSSKEGWPQYCGLLDPQKGYLKFFRFAQSNKELHLLYCCKLSAQDDVGIWIRIMVVIKNEKMLG